MTASRRRALVVMLGFVAVVAVALLVRPGSNDSAHDDEAVSACKKVVQAGQDFQAGASTRARYRSVVVDQQPVAADAVGHGDRAKAIYSAILRLNVALATPADDVEGPLAELTAQCGR